MTNESVINKCKEKRGEINFDYSCVDYEKTKPKIKVFCKKHNQFFMPNYYDFLRGTNCQQCAKENRSLNIKKAAENSGKCAIKDTDDFIKKAKELRPEFDYSKTVYVDRNKKVIVIFEGEEYTITPRVLLKGGLPFELSIKNRGIKKAKNRWKNIEEELNEIHKSKYIYSKKDLDKIKSGLAHRDYAMTIFCRKHGEFYQTFFDHRNGSGCQKCAIENRPIINISNPEKEIRSIIEKYYNGKIIYNDRKILNGSELDIYIPTLKIAFEYDGFFWHNNVDNSYKFEKCRNLGIRLIRIAEDQLNETFLKNSIGIFENIIDAEKCSLQEIDCKKCIDFLLDNSFMEIKSVEKCFALVYNGIEVEILAISDNYLIHSVKYDWKINNGLKTLLKCYKGEKILKVQKDKYSIDSYLENGFTILKETKPNYRVVKRGYISIDYGDYILRS